MKTLPVSLLLVLFAWTVCAWANRGRQKRAWIIESFSIEEENPGPFPYILGKIELERSYLVRYQLKGQGVDLEPSGILDIDKEGNVLVYRKLDFENEQGIRVLKSTFEARDNLNNEVDTRLGVHIEILDINDHAPKFQKSIYEVSVNESLAQGKEVLTVLASDEDDTSTNNGTFDLTIKSVTPTTDNVKFYIQQRKGQTFGNIYFYGCLNYEKAQKYTILVEAKDKGEKIQLSSTSTVIINILDTNNNLPGFSGKTGPGKVKERVTGVEVLRLQVTDKDTRGSKAWKAKFTIHGDKKEQFKIETDPDTNEGILTVVKQMDYEEQTYQSLSISVQNEIPYFSCKVKKQVENAKWEVDVIPQNSGMSVENLYNTIPVTIYVEDINDPPVFISPVKHVHIMENIAAGTSLTTFTAKDMDGSHINTFKFVKGEDIDRWITVDAKTGQVSTKKILDRESPFGINNTYRATIYAVDDGVPPLTGTGTLFIHLNDQNDNVPMLEVNTVTMCLDTEPTVANITAVDLDLPPYSSPFHYELLGDVKDKWRIEPTYGTTVSLVKEHGVYSGHHLLQIKIFDQQRLSSIQNLSVTVCDCSIAPNCHLRMAQVAQMGPAAAWIIVLTVLIFIVFSNWFSVLQTMSKMQLSPSDDELNHSPVPPPPSAGPRKTSSPPDIASEPRASSRGRRSAQATPHTPRRRGLPSPLPSRTPAFSPASSYCSTVPTILPIGKWTVMSLRQALINSDMQPSRRMNKAQLYNLYVTLQSSKSLSQVHPSFHGGQQAEQNSGGPESTSPGTVTFSYKIRFSACISPQRQAFSFHRCETSLAM